MHAKMTRDRKKNFIATIEKTIEELERDCQKMRDVLNKVGAHQQVLEAPVAPLTSPREPVLVKPEPQVEAPAPAAATTTAAASTATTTTFTNPLLSAAIAMAPVKLPSETKSGLSAESPPKRAKVSHGFSWNG